MAAMGARQADRHTAKGKIAVFMDADCLDYRICWRIVASNGTEFRPLFSGCGSTLLFEPVGKIVHEAADLGGKIAPMRIDGIDAAM